MNREQFLNKMRAHSQPKAVLVKAAVAINELGERSHHTNMIVSKSEQKVKTHAKAAALAA